jgi:two-component system heavy metal sensor histidine kinase CusS
MSSKTVAKTARGAWSITGWLTFFYAVVTFLMLALSGTFLYWVLADYLERKDNLFLTTKVHVIRRALLTYAEHPEVLAHEVNWDIGNLQATPWYSRVLDKDGRTIAETPGMAAILPPGLFPGPIGATESPTRVWQWQSSEGKSYLLVAARAAHSGKGTADGTIQIALDVSHDAELLIEYRKNLAIVLFWGILLSSGAGVAITLRGLRPLEAITKTAERVTASQLHERIEPSHWPKELSALAAAFDGMLTRLDRSFIRLSQFSMNLAHELRSPINNLMGETEVALSRRRTEEEYRQVLESSLEEYRKLSGIIDSLLFLARAESTQGSIERSRLEARKEIEGLLDYYDALAEERGIRLSCSGEAILNADPILFARAACNLLTNAIQYTPPGGHINVSIHERPDRSVEIGVQDNGVGILAKYLHNVFDPFYRVDPARSHHPEGTGLGLAIVKSIMMLHGGEVSLESEPNKGTQVTLRFPPPAESWPQAR